METLLLFLEGALALIFFAAGGSKLLWSREALVPVVPYATVFSDIGFRRFGAVELAASIGLLVPVFVGGLELLAPVAAAVLIALQTWAGFLHWRRSRNGAYVILTILLVSGLLLIVWGRLGPYPL